ncbi:MAG: hypothetical protein LJF30_07315 [Acidobacteria bacterium]|nr:hypothetical protein [Acidobacteriota bacterium]
MRRITAGGEEISPPGARRRSPWRPVLLSGLVFPGLGQIVSGRPWRGLVYGLGSLVVLIAVLRRVARETLARMPDDPTAIDPLFPFRLAHEIQADNAAFFFWLTLVLVALWVGSVVDAWLTVRPSEGRR